MKNGAWRNMVFVSILCIGYYSKAQARLCICLDSFRFFTVAWATFTNSQCIPNKKLYLACLYCMFATPFLPCLWINVVSSWALLPIGIFKYYLSFSKKLIAHLFPAHGIWYQLHHEISRNVQGLNWCRLNDIIIKPWHVISNNVAFWQV